MLTMDMHRVAKITKWLMYLGIAFSVVYMPTIERNIIKFEQERGIYRNAQGEIIK